MTFHDQARGALHESVACWKQFFAKCLNERLNIDSFRQFLPLIRDKHPAPPVIIADLILKPRHCNNISLDPCIPPYTHVLIQLGCVDAPSILQALYKYSWLHAQLNQSCNGNECQGGVLEEERRRSLWQVSSWSEEAILHQVIMTVFDGSAFRDTRDALTLIRIVCRWMDLFSTVCTAFAADVLGQVDNSQAREDVDVIRAAFIPLLLRLVETPSFLQVISGYLAKGIRKQLSESLAGFIHTLQPGPGFVERLEIFRNETLARLDQGHKKKQIVANPGIDEFLEPTVELESFVIPDLPISNTCAGLYIYLNAALVGRPLIDDVAILSFLQNRYQGETQSSAICLILASFDILANSVFRNEGPKDAPLLRSFLINKVPLLLRQLFPPHLPTTSSEFCITEALNQVDTSVFPTASLLFDESRSNNPYTESVREEFCTACAIHGLVRRDHVERILGETSMSYEPSLEKYSKEKLVQSCLSDPGQIQGLVRELDKMDGNVGAVCQALVELMRQLCASKETMTLKRLCSQLAHRPQSLDFVLLFEKLPAVLLPLCQLLDNWRYEEDQGEYQPIYDEFGAILLLVLAYVYRYNLRADDLGILPPDSCVAKIIRRAHIGRPLDELTKQEHDHVGRWIRGLFDSEPAGLGDDLMSSCHPQDFYLLTATIFQNIVTGYSQGYLNDERLKTGIEYVVDTFLLPSLVPALRYLADQLCVENKEQKSILKIIQLILLPSSISGEASAMLSSVKNLVAKPLEYALRSYQKQDPKNQDIEPLLSILKDSLPLYRRTGGSEHNEFTSWASSSSSGLVGAIRYTVQGLVQWSMHPGINVMPTSYTHRQLIVACRMAGKRRVLSVMIDETRNQSDAGNANIVYDVVAALICAPDVTNEPLAATGLLDASGNIATTQQRRLTLRDMLKSEAENYRHLRIRDAVLAETVVRLHRRVEALMVLPQPQTMLQGQDMTSLDLSGAAAGLDDAMAAATGVQDNGMAVDAVTLDMGLGGVSSDLGLGGASSGVGVVGVGGGLDTASDADLFGGIDTHMDMFDGWDGMDLGGT